MKELPVSWIVVAGIAAVAAIIITGYADQLEKAAVAIGTFIGIIAAKRMNRDALNTVPGDLVKAIGINGKADQ